MNATGASLLSNSILSRSPLGARSFAPVLSPLQSEVDTLVGGFTHQATDWRSLAAMVAGGAAYRLGRVGVMGLGSGNGIRLASVGLGLTAEVSAFEITNRGLITFSGRSTPESNLWRWSGSGGIRQGLFQSFITFGTLKGAGRLAVGENLVVRHLLQDTAMVAGHQISGALEIAPRPHGTLAEQFLHAEATNLQIGAGLALAHGFAPRIHALERGLDLSLRPNSVGANLVFAFNGDRDGRTQGSPLPALATTGSRGASSMGEKRLSPQPLTMAMSSGRDGAISSWPPPAEEIPEALIPGRKISGVHSRQGDEPYPYVALGEYQAQTLVLIRMGLSSEEIGRVLEREGRGGLSLEEAAKAPSLRGLLLAEASNLGLAQGVFPRSTRQWSMVQRLIESAYVHFDLETLRSYREGLSPEWWVQYRAFLNSSAEAARRRVGVPLQRLDRPLPGEYILPRTDRLRDSFLRQIFHEKTVEEDGLNNVLAKNIFPMENVMLLRDPQKLGELFGDTFINAFMPLVTMMDYLKRMAPGGNIPDLLNPRYEVQGVLASMREKYYVGLRETPEYVRIFKGREGPFHRAFIQSVFKQVNGDRLEVSYEQVRVLIDQLPEEMRRELGAERLPPLSEILSP